MKCSLVGCIVALAALGLPAQVPAPKQPELAPIADPAEAVLIPAGTPLGLELQDSLNTKFTKRGDQVSFKVTPEVRIGERVAVPRESAVDARIVSARRGGMAQRRGELRFEFERIVLADGTSLPLAARLTRVGRWNRSNKVTQTAPGDRDIWSDLLGIAELAGIGAILGGEGGGGKGAAIGAAAGAGIGIAAILMERGPELDLPPGIMFQVELTKPLKVPLAAAGGMQLAASRSPLPSPPASESPTESVTAAPGTPKPPSDVNEPSKVEIPTPVAATVSTPTPPVPVQPPTLVPVAASEPSFMFSVDVNLVMVEATVRDERGAIYIKLKREDFLVSEDGVAQEILHFSRDELPLAVALVIDRSGSVIPFMDRLRRAAYETLSQLKPGDQVALFAFAERTERLENLTADRRAIADSIATIQAGGGTNIKDALFDAAAYLGREAPSRRHAIILISDNQETVSSRRDETQVIRTALETESVIYSIEVLDRSPLRRLANPVPIPHGGSVREITRETGGEIFNAKGMGSVESAMQAAITRLKLRFTLGYQSTNQQRDGAFRKIEVRLAHREPLTQGFTVYARRGYYALKPGEELFRKPSADFSTAALPARLLDRPVMAGVSGQIPTKPFTNDDVLKLTKAGFGQETILEAIRTNRCLFDTSAEAMLALKEAGVDEKTIMAILGAARAPASASAPGGEGDGLPALAGIYVLQDGKYVSLATEQVHWRPNMFLPYSTSGGRTTATLKAKMPTSESSLRLSGSPEILLVCPGGASEIEYHLLRAENDKKGREFRAEFETLEDVSDDYSSTFYSSFVTSGGTRKNEVRFTAKELAAGKFRLKLPELGKGEYAFLPPTKGQRGELFTFGVK